jgi:hypothetical protein
MLRRANDALLTMTNGRKDNKSSSWLAQIVLELVEAAEPAVIVLVALARLWELAVRQNDFRGGVAQMEKIEADESLLPRRIGGPAPSERKLFRRFDLR